MFPVTVSAPLAVNGVVLAISEFAQTRNLKSLKSRRQGSVYHAIPRTTVSRRPEPVVAAGIVVAPAHEIEIVRYANRHIDGRLCEVNHPWGRMYDDRRRGANVHVDINIGSLSLSP